MIAAVNATCQNCNQFRPRCATVCRKSDGKQFVVCEPCRKALKSLFRIHSKHRSKP